MNPAEDPEDSPAAVPPPIPDPALVRARYDVRMRAPDGFEYMYQFGGSFIVSSPTSVLSGQLPEENDPNWQGFFRIVAEMARLLTVKVAEGHDAVRREDGEIEYTHFTMVGFEDAPPNRDVGDWELQHFESEVIASSE